jgi:ABC-type microcin C transport system permease subunit YejB
MGSALLTGVGWSSIAAGLLVAFSGSVLIAAIFSGRGVPIGGAGTFMLLTLIAAPLLLIAGAAAVVSGAKLMGGHSWARAILVAFWWITLLSSIAYVVHAGVTKNEIYRKDIMKSAMFLLVTGIPSLIMILLLRSSALRHALKQ